MSEVTMPCPRLGRSIRGTSLVDVMVATVLLSVIMAGAYSNLVTQMRTHAVQTMTSEAMNEIRVGSRVMAEQIAMAGFGVPTATTPSAVAKLITAKPTELSFLANVNAEHTFLTAAGLKGATSVPVVSAGGLTNGGSIYITDTANWYAGTVQSVSGNTVFISPGLSYDFAAGSEVTHVDQVTFRLVGSQLQRNGHPIIDNVTDLTFSYDSTTLSNIREITLTLSGQTRAVDVSTGQKHSVSVTTRVAPPNLGL